MRFHSLFAALLLVPTALPVEASNINPSQIVAIFCSGLATGDMSALQPLLTDDLAKAIADAQAKNAAFLKAHPGAKAPLADGIPWLSRGEKPDRCMLVGMSGTYDVPLAFINYSFADPSKDFSDKMALRFVNNELRVDNIQYGKGGGDLKARLAAAFPN